MDPVLGLVGPLLLVLSNLRVLGRIASSWASVVVGPFVLLNNSFFEIKRKKYEGPKSTGLILNKKLRNWSIRSSLVRVTENQSSYTLKQRTLKCWYYIILVGNIVPVKLYDKI
jgi:hypothetical protein